MDKELDAVRQDNLRAKETIEKLFSTMCSALETAKSKTKLYSDEAQKLAVENDTLTEQNKKLSSESDVIEADIKKAEAEQKDLIEKAEALSKEITTLEEERKKLKEDIKDMEKDERQKQELIKKREEDVAEEQAKRDLLSTDTDKLVYFLLMELLPDIPQDLRPRVKALAQVLQKENRLLQVLAEMTQGALCSEEDKAKAKAALAWKEGEDFVPPPLPPLPDARPAHAGGGKGGKGHPHGLGGGAGPGFRGQDDRRRPQGPRDSQGGRGGYRKDDRGGGPAPKRRREGSPDRRR